MKFLFLLLLLAALHAQAATIVLASTTSVENSGLLAHILPAFTAASGIAVKVVAQGTGQALATAASGDADLVFVHDPEAEAAFIAAGHGINRRPIAWNDFLLVGPRDDPARINGGRDVVVAFRAIAASRAAFVSRGDRSGTDALEKRLWQQTDINPTAQPWYRDIGGGMGAALNMAAAIGATTLTDRGTWLAFANRRDLVEQVAGDPRMINRYSVIEINPQRHPHVKSAAARALADWLAGPTGQAAIGGFTLRGTPLFHPGAAP